ncbi:RQC-minor-1 family DNA-binding protein [Paenibacillus tyrfis]|uniref:RQC-minor-1 family DNA-binding protein n=1 Tax=Paenibacillus tyrfis TaxID=1501230 RepID=UPI000B595E66|nr:RQC-minor-1 family DNA-binding protein [Paenibacillus tyrfis]
MGIQLTNEEILAILRATDEIIGLGGRTLLAKILKGSRDKKVLELGLDHCPIYGYFRAQTLEQIMEKVDWMIHHDFLEIQFSGKLPMLVFTEQGWTIERSQIVEELLKEWDAWLRKGVTDADMSYLKERNRGMILELLETVKRKRASRYVPFLEQWEKIEVKKVREAIRETIAALRSEDGLSSLDGQHEQTEFTISRLEPELLKCRECGDRFRFEVEEQKFYKSKGFAPPKRCPKCREKKWFRKMGIELPDDDMEEES